MTFLENLFLVGLFWSAAIFVLIIAEAITWLLFGSQTDRKHRRY